MKTLIISALCMLPIAAFADEHPADTTSKPGTGVPVSDAATHADLVLLEQIELRILFALKEMQAAQAQKGPQP